MLPKAEVYQWFTDLHGWNRIDFICNIIGLCNPLELRFIGSCIEGMAQADRGVLKDQEVKANSLQTFEQFLKKSQQIEEFRSHVAIWIALLEPQNYKVAAKMGDQLEEKIEGLNSQQLMDIPHQIELEQWMLLLSLALYHPAFNFNKQLKFKEKLAEFERMQIREKQIRRAHHFPQKQWVPSSWEPSEDGEWTHILGKIDNGHAIPTTMRPTHFPATLISPTVTSYQPMDAYYSPSVMPNLTNPIVHSNRQAQDKIYVPSSKVYSPPPVTVMNKSMAMEGSMSSSSVPGIDDNSQRLTATSLQSTVTQPKTFTNVTSVLSTVVTTSVATSHVSCGKSCNQLTTNVTLYKANPTSAFITIPTSKNIGTSSNKVCYEISTKQQFKGRNRSQSGDTSSSRQKHSKARTITHFSAQPLRSSTSAPILASTGQTNTAKPSQGTGSNDKTLSTSTENARMRQSPRPMNLFVKSKGKNSSYRFEITWTDGTTSECDHTVQEIIYFYKQIATKLGRNSAAIEAFAKQNSQTMDRGPKLENIFSNFINNYVKDSNIEDIRQFFKHNMPPPMAQPRRKLRQASKSRQAADGSSSSSSTWSPPLVNSTKTKILQSSVPRLNATASPPPAKNVTSLSSVRSSSSSIASIPTNMEEATESSLDDRNDPYLKLYYWLKRHKLTDIYSHLKKYTFDEFCKLQPADVDSVTVLSTQQKSSLKEAMMKLSLEEKRDTAVDISMDALCISSKTCSSDTSSDNGKIKDIKSILEDVARQSEEERSGSSQSLPVSFTHCSNIEVAISDPGFSFEFEGSENGEKIAPSSQTNKIPHNPPIVPFIPRNRTVEPAHVFSQEGMFSADDVTLRSHFNQPLVSNTRYSSGPCDNPQNVTHNWYHCHYTQSYLTSSPYKIMRKLPAQGKGYMANVHSSTIPCCMHSQSSKPSQYVYAENATKIRSATESDTVAIPYLQVARLPSHLDVSQSPQNLDVDNQSSPTSSDTDHALQQLGDSITTESVIPSVPASGNPGHSYYALAPGYGTLHQPLCIGNAMHPLSPSYSDSTIYLWQTQRNFKKSEHHQPNITSSVSAHAMNGYPESRPISQHRMHQDSNRGQHKRHNYGDGPKRGSVVHCCNCGKKGHDSTACCDCDITAADEPKSDVQLEFSSSRKLKAMK